MVSTVSLAGVPALAAPVHVYDTNRDGVPELILQFDAAGINRALSGNRTPEVTIDGEILDTVWFLSSRYLRGVAVIDPVGGQP